MSSHERSRPAGDLPQAGHARADVQPALDVGVVALDLGGQGRARPDEAHLAAEHVEQLGQLVDGEPADDGARPG